MHKSDFAVIVPNMNMLKNSKTIYVKMLILLFDWNYVLIINAGIQAFYKSIWSLNMKSCIFIYIYFLTLWFYSYMFSNINRLKCN